jgi:hypothetical protein
MATIKNRILVLEQLNAKNKLSKPRLEFLLPTQGDPSRECVQSEIAALQNAGQKVIVYEVV